MSDASRLLTAKELAHAMNMSVGSIYRLTRAGRLPGAVYSAGPSLSGVRFDLAQVRNALQRVQVGNAAEVREGVAVG